MKPPIEGKTVEKMEALSYQPDGTTRIVKGRWYDGGRLYREKEVKNFDYLPTDWPDGYDEVEVLRITFTDGSSVTFHPRGWETDGIGLHYVKGAAP